MRLATNDQSIRYALRYHGPWDDDEAAVLMFHVEDAWGTGAEIECRNPGLIARVLQASSTPIPRAQQAVEVASDGAPKLIDLHSMPERKRVSWSQQEGNVYIGRREGKLPQSKWANTRGSTKTVDPKTLCDRCEPWIRSRIHSDPEKYDTNELTGKTMGCWCSNGVDDKPCHGKVLSRIWKEQRSPKWKQPAAAVVHEGLF